MQLPHTEACTELRVVAFGQRQVQPSFDSSIRQFAERIKLSQVRASPEIQRERGRGGEGGREGPLSGLPICVYWEHTKPVVKL